MLVQLIQHLAQILLLHCDQLILSHILRAGPDDDVIYKRVGTSRTGQSKSSLMRWKAALPFLAPMGSTFNCMGPRGIDIAVQGLESWYSGIWY